MTSRLGLLGILLLAVACGAPEEVESGEANLSTTAVDAFGEQLEENEAETIDRIAAAARQQVEDSMRSDPSGVARRDAHPKAHGCVTGSFAVNRDLPAELRVGTFQPGKTYDAWIRFSNGSQADDRDNDARGMAIKLLGVDGARLLGGEDPGARTHDLVLSNHHTFFIAKLGDYVKFMETVANKGNPLSFFFESWNPFNWHIREALLARAFTKQPISNPVTSRYFSVTPYTYGDRVVKYSATPCGGADTSGDHADDPHYLAAALKQSLASGDACFEFAIQVRTPEMSVEDSTVTWEEDDAPFVPVAKLTIPKQTFDSAAQTKLCENLSFTPWHATKEHRPLGSTNRARKVVYETTSEARHRLNGTPRVEPTDLTVR